MAAAGVRVKEFRSIWEALARGALSLLDRRNHRKLMVVDERVGYWGGMNIVDNLEAGPRGVGVEGAEGEAGPGRAGRTGGVGGMCMCGWRTEGGGRRGSWRSRLSDRGGGACGERVARRPRVYRRAALVHGEAGEEGMRFFDSGPGLKYSRGARVYAGLLRHARRTVFLSMAYFVPVGRPLRALLRGAAAGVRVRIVVPGKSDVPVVQRATAYLYGKLLRRGFRVYERRDRMLHAKVMVVDGEYTVVGSCNLDPRSLYTNLEFLGVVRSARFAEVVTEICRYEMGHSNARDAGDGGGRGVVGAGGEPVGVGDEVVAVRKCETMNAKR